MSTGSAFISESTDAVVIPSTWKRDVMITDTGMQTEPLPVSDQEVQTLVSALQPVDQQDKSEGTVRLENHKASLEGVQYIYSGVEYSEEKLANFVESCKDTLLAILYKNSRSNAFDNYEPNWTLKSTDLLPVYTLSSPHAMEGELNALDVAWNANGTMVAVAYGRMDASGWCYSNGYVCIWNLLRPDLDEHAPHFMIVTDTYATCLSFHPSNALMLAVGTYSGEVVVFPNVSEDVPTEWSTSAANTHQEPITMLQWVQNIQELRDSHRYLLCSAAQDGQLAFWAPNNKLAFPVALYSVRNRKHVQVGISSVSYSCACVGRHSSIPSIDGVLIVGLENGDVGRGRTGFISADAEKPPEMSIPLELDWLDGHRGPVQSICTSPFFRHLFVSCSSDGSAHLYNDMERTPLLSLEPSMETKHFLYDTQLSPFRPGVVVLVSRSSFLHIYDLKVSQSKPVYSAEAGLDGAPAVSLAFNPYAPEWLATGDTRGNVRVWRLPTEISQSTEAERAAVRAEQNAGKAQPGGNAGAAGAGAAPKEKDAIRELFGFTL